jgi:hypothetical protein
MKKITTFLAAFLAATGLMAQNAWINEFHYDNNSTDVDEFIEVVIENPGNYDLVDFEITLYNGNVPGAAVVYASATLDTYTVGATSGNFTFYYLNYTAAGGSIQNGTADGICLSYQGNPISGQLLSYEGVFTASDGPAAGLTSVDIGVEETSSTAAGMSLQLSGTGSQYSAFVWQAPATATMGQLNNDQVLGTYTPDPEPSNYPTSFAAEGIGLSAMLSWTDATGTQLPAAYLIKASTSSTIAIPVDGTPEANDSDLSDGTGAWNVTFGDQAFIWDGLEASTKYYFKIFPYTNYGSYIDYKTDGTVPAANATTQTIVQFYNFDDGLDPWTQFSVNGDQFWAYDSIHGVDGTGCAKMSGYSGGNVANEDWLISPSMDWADLHGLKLRFYTAENYGSGSNPLTILISTDYNSGDPTSNGSWTDIGQGVTLSSGSWVWTPSEFIDLSDYNQTNVHVAFKYISTADDAPTWEVDNVLISANSGVGIKEAKQAGPAFEMYPNPCKNWFFVNIKENGSYEISLVDVSGRNILTKRTAEGACRIDTKSLNPGIFIVRVRDTKTGALSTSRVVVR